MADVTGLSPSVASETTSLPAEGGPQVGLAPLEFEIVPRLGLLISGILAVLLVIAVAANKLWPLEFLHVVGGSAWTIVDLFVGFVVGPIIGRMSVPARIEFTTRFMPKMVVLMPTVVAVTLTAGWQLSTKLGTNLTSYPQHGWIVASFVVVGVMAVTALGWLEPANIAVLVELKKRRPNPAVIEKLMHRFVYASGVLGVTQVATFVIMTKLSSS